MARPGRTQKQTAELYKGNLGYYARFHLWRGARLLVSLLAIAATIAGIWLFSRWGRQTFFNPGRISSSHASIADKCSACHDKSLLGDSGLTARKFTVLTKQRFHNGIAFAPIDRKCEVCHKLHAFHEANVVQNRSCSACHQEHAGSRALRLVASANCISCHGQPSVMAAAAEKGMQLPRDAFHRHPFPPQQVVFKLPRPPRGFTQTFTSFWNDHPEFQLDREKVRDPDVLRFNHQRHFAADIPPLNGHRLACNDCHKPDPNGRYYQRITFANDCQTCHSLQFDRRNPELKLPHGDVRLVRTFLRTLPAQYADYARLKQGRRTDREVQNFVAQQINQLRRDYGSGLELEQAVFFTTDPYKPERRMGARTRANFAGCAYCHEVKLDTAGIPVVTKPILIDRWMPRANFNHAKHQIDPATQNPLDCNSCHHAARSRETSDILMPVKANCVICHSPKGKAVSECMTCHVYHAPPSAQVAVTASIAEPTSGAR